MKKPIIVIGIGEMGGVFARGFLRSGFPVYPVVRGMDINQIANEIAEPELVLVTVGENDLHDVLNQIPKHWHDRLMLLQNELLPNDWQKHQLENPTVISVWFEKKKGIEAKVIIPSPIFGPNAQKVHDALALIDLPCKILNSDEELLFQLVVKNVYIATTNIAGLETGGTVSELWNNHREIAETVSKEVIAIQQKLSGQTFDTNQLVAAMVTAFNGDPDHKCMGRSAPARLQRALNHAEQYEITVPKMKAIAKQFES